MKANLIQMTLEMWGGIFCLICCIFVSTGRKATSRRRWYLSLFLIVEAIQLFSDSIAWFYRGDMSTIGWYAVRISNYLVFASNYLMAVIAVFYMQSLLKDKEIRVHLLWRIAIFTGSAAALALVTVSQFTDYLYYFDKYNFYHRSPGFWTISILAAVMLVLLISFTLSYRRYLAPIQYLPLLGVFTLPLIADLVQLLHYGISFANLSMMAAVILMFLFYEIERSRKLAEQERSLMENRVELADHQAKIATQRAELATREAELATQRAENATQKAELAEKNTKIMLSQIQPHFLYNTLGSIEYLCDIDAKRAKEAIHHFAKYLRMNVNALSQNDMVRFEKELDYTQAYLWIEKMRFEDDLQIVYDLQETDFMIPQLTLQPIVENAVRHGICSVPDGGTVTISSRRVGEDIVLTVKDTGCGYDVDVRPNDNRRHVGIENVRGRLQLMCNGSLKVESYPGLGTIVQLILPVSAVTVFDGKETS